MQCHARQLLYDFRKHLKTKAKVKFRITFKTVTKYVTVPSAVGHQRSHRIDVVVSCARAETACTLFTLKLKR